MTNNSIISAIQPQIETYLAYFTLRPEGEEVEYRYFIEDLFKTLALPFMDKTTIIQEDRRSGIEIDGMPDFFVWDDNTFNKSLIGFIECKKPSYNLDKLIGSEQIKKYSKTCENIIITNYKRFILLQNGKKQHDIILDNETKTLLDFVTLLQDFYGYKYPYIKTKKILASSLAAQSFYYSVALRQYIENKSNADQSFYIKFNGLYGEYEKTLNFHYILADFCDIYSQSLVYGLLLARLDQGEELDEHRLNYLENIPEEYGLLYEFLEQGYQSRSLPTEIKIALTNIGKNINLIDTDTVTKEFQTTDDGRQNIAVYLYEDFLANYDKFRGTENRREGGVYYTPQQATDFITRCVNHLLKDSFNLSQGYNAETVKVLDFSCGTGTFLRSVFEQMIPERPDRLQKMAIKNKITKDIYGFELLFTPYIVAHTFLRLFLQNKGIELGAERLGVYLTNTLDISSHAISDLLPNLKKEYEKAQGIKDSENILAIVGNPPYFNGKSRAKSEVIDGHLKKYKQGLNERKINLDDEYIKFIRFAELKIQKNGHGIVGIITNNSFLDGVTHRQMRKHLYETFDEIYIVNLHGNSRKAEEDKNIFDIMVGVSITIFVKHKEPTKKKVVKYFSTLENNIIKRQEKFDFLEKNTLKTIRWTKLNPQKDEFYWFVDKDMSHEKEYKKFWKVTDVFAHYGSGMKTDKDKVTMHYRKQSLEKVLSDFKLFDEYRIKDKYKVEDSRDWTVATAKKDIINNIDKDLFTDIHYRPMDNRVTFYTGKSRGFMGTPSRICRDYFINYLYITNYENIGLCFTRDLQGKNWHNVFVSNKPIDLCIVNHNTYLAPLYIYNGGNGYAEMDFDGKKRYANFSQEFLKKYIQKLKFQPSPEDVLAYIYAVLHSKIYRTKYLEFLKTDFPSVPMTFNKDTFHKYSVFGHKLIDLHLFKNLPNDKTIRVDYDFDGDFVIDKISYNNNILSLFTTDNKRITFESVDENIYNFVIGSYKPIDKWLKYRIKDKVSLGVSDLQHIKNMIIVLKNTNLVMQDIEKLGEEYLK